MNSLLLSILANLSVDYLIPGEMDRDKLRPIAIMWHGVAVFGSLLIFLHGYQWLKTLGYIALLTGVHVLIDSLQGLINRSQNRSLNLLGYIMTQVLKLLAIILFWSWFNLQANQGVMSFYQTIFPAKILPSFSGITNGSYKLTPEHLLVGGIIYIYICFGGSVLIEKFLLWLRNREEIIRENMDRIGKWIGILERVIVLSLILNNAIGSVALILTAKSIARFSELSDRNFAEYYLIGTLSSTTLAICGGFLLNYLLAII